VWSNHFVIPPEELSANATPKHSRFDANISSMRVHELAVMRWLNQRFLVADGYPMPVLFSKPMSAFSDFRQLWQQDNGPFAYLLQAKDKEGRPLYQPHPSPPIYPLLTINRKSWKFAPQRNFGSQWKRHAGWPTVSNDVKKKDLGTAREQRMPQGWDYSITIDHYATRPDQQAHFIQELQLGWFPSASVPNTWIKAVYPDIFGKKLIRVLLEGDITDSTEEEPVDNYRVYRTTVNLIVEGWVPDPDFIYVNTFWVEAEKATAISPADLEAAFNPEVTQMKDLRDTENNGIFNTATGMPPS
jgi:hypothetical protein